jgi:hypothetical protein
LLATLNGATRTHVVFLSVPDADAEWVRTDLWRHAAAMPGVSVHEDPGGGTATLFGAATSGQVVVYSSAGQLLFQGGITASRGHEGWSAGSESVVAMVRGASAETTATPVFGCPLFRAEAPGGQRGEGS